MNTMERLGLAVRAYCALVETPVQVGPATLWAWDKLHEALRASGQPEVAVELGALPPAERELVMEYLAGMEPLAPLGKTYVFETADNAKLFAGHAAAAGSVEQFTPLVVNVSETDYEMATEAAKALGGVPVVSLVEEHFEHFDGNLLHDMVAAKIPLSAVERAAIEALSPSPVVPLSEAVMALNVPEAAFRGRLAGWAKPRNERVLAGVRRTYVEAFRMLGWVPASLRETVDRWLAEDAPTGSTAGSTPTASTDTGKGGAAKDQPDVKQGSPAASKSEPGKQADAPTEHVPTSEEGAPDGDVKLADGTVVPQEVLRQAFAKFLQQLATQVQNNVKPNGTPETPKGDGAAEEGGEDDEKDAEAGEAKPEGEKPVEEKPAAPPAEKKDEKPAANERRLVEVQARSKSGAIFDAAATRDDKVIFTLAGSKQPKSTATNKIRFEYIAQAVRTGQPLTLSASDYHPMDAIAPDELLRVMHELGFAGLDEARQKPAANERLVREGALPGPAEERARAIARQRLDDVRGDGATPGGRAACDRAKAAILAKAESVPADKRAILLRAAELCDEVKAGRLVNPPPGAIFRPGPHLLEARQPHPADECENCGHERDVHQGSRTTTRTSGDGTPCDGRFHRGCQSRCQEFVPVEGWGYDDGKGARAPGYESVADRALAAIRAGKPIAEVAKATLAGKLGEGDDYRQDAFGLYGAVRAARGEQAADAAWNAAFAILTGRFKATPAAATNALRSKWGRHLADQVVGGGSGDVVAAVEQAFSVAWVGRTLAGALRGMYERGPGKLTESQVLGIAAPSKAPKLAEGDQSLLAFRFPDYTAARLFRDYVLGHYAFSVSRPGDNRADPNAVEVGTRDAARVRSAAKDHDGVEIEPWNSFDESRKRALAEDAAWICPVCRKPEVTAGYLGWRSCGACGWEERRPTDLQRAESRKGAAACTVCETIRKVLPQESCGKHAGQRALAEGDADVQSAMRDVQSHPNDRGAWERLLATASRAGRKVVWKSPIDTFYLEKIQGDLLVFVELYSEKTTSPLSLRHGEGAAAAGALKLFEGWASSDNPQLELAKIGLRNAIATYGIIANAEDVRRHLSGNVAKHLPGAVEALSSVPREVFDAIKKVDDVWYRALLKASGVKESRLTEDAVGKLSPAERAFACEVIKPMYGALGPKPDDLTDRDLADFLELWAKGPELKYWLYKLEYLQMGRAIRDKVMAAGVRRLHEAPLGESIRSDFQQGKSLASDAGSAFRAAARALEASKDPHAPGLASRVFKIAGKCSDIFTDADELMRQTGGLFEGEQKASKQGEQDEKEIAAQAIEDASELMRGLKAAAFSLVTAELVKVEAIAKATDNKKGATLAAKFRERLEELHEEIKDALGDFEKLQAAFKGGAKAPEAAPVEPAAAPAPAAEPAPAPQAPAAPAAAPAPAEQPAAAAPVPAQESTVGHALRALAADARINQLVAEHASYPELRDAVRARRPELNPYEIAEAIERLQRVSAALQERPYRLELTERDRELLRSVSLAPQDAPAVVAERTAGGRKAVVNEADLRAVIEALRQMGDAEHQILAEELERRMREPAAAGAR